MAHLYPICIPFVSICHMGALVKIGSQSNYPLVNSQFAIENGPVRVDLPLKNGDFPWFSISMCVSQRVMGWLRVQHMAKNHGWKNRNMKNITGLYAFKLTINLEGENLHVAERYPCHTAWASICCWTGHALHGFGDDPRLAGRGQRIWNLQGWFPTWLCTMLPTLRIIQQFFPLLEHPRGCRIFVPFPFLVGVYGVYLVWTAIFGDVPSLFHFETRL